MHCWTCLMNFVEFDLNYYRESFVFFCFFDLGQNIQHIGSKFFVKIQDAFKITGLYLFLIIDLKFDCAFFFASADTSLFRKLTLMIYRIFAVVFAQKNTLEFPKTVKLANTGCVASILFSHICES